MNESYWKANYYSAFIPVVYCPKCKEIRAEEEMVVGKNLCKECLNQISTYAPGY